MGAAGFRCLSEILEEQYVAAALKYKEKALQEKIRVRVEDTVELIVDYAEKQLPYPYDWAEADALTERKEQEFLNGSFITPSTTGNLHVSTSTTISTTAGVSSDRAATTVTSLTATTVSTVASEPTIVVPKIPKHPINAPVSQSMDMTQYLSKTTATNVSTNLPTKAKKYTSKTLQADGRPLESSNSTAPQSTTSKTSSKKRKRTTPASSSKVSNAKSTSVSKPAQSTASSKTSGRMSSLMSKPTEPDGLSDTDFSSDSESTARLSKHGTTTTKSVENSKTTTPLKRLQKTKDKVLYYDSDSFCCRQSNLQEA